MFDYEKFSVKLHIDKLTRIPYAAGDVFVRWNVTDSPRPDAHGRTVNRPIDQSEATFNYKSSFKQRIGLRSPSNELRSCTIKFEIMWNPEGSHYISLGMLSLNLAEYASRLKKRKNASFSLKSDDSKRNNNSAHNDSHHHHHHHHHHNSSSSNTQNHNSSFFVSNNDNFSDNLAYGQGLLYMLTGARNNALLQLRIEVDPFRDDFEFAIPDFTGPCINFSGDGGVNDDGNGDPRLQGISGGPHSRAKVRDLREAVFNDLRKDEGSKVSDSHNLDLLLMGKTERQKSEIPVEEFQKYHVYPLGDDPEIVFHKNSRPYQELEIRDSFATWGDYKYT